MSGMRTLEENIEALEEANDQTRAIIREAHETIQTARLVLAELREERDRWEAGIRDVVDAAVETQVELGLESFKSQTAKATQESYARVIGEFDKLKNLMLHGNARGRGSSLVEDWVRDAVRAEVRRQLRGGR